MNTKMEFMKRTLDQQKPECSGNLNSSDCGDETQQLINKDADKARTESDNRPEPSRKRKFIIMLACMYLQFAYGGMSIALGVIYVELTDAFHAPRSEAALVQSVYLGMSLGGGVFFTGTIRRFDVGICVIISSVLGTACLIVSSFAWNMTMIIVLVGFGLGLSQSLNMLTSNAVINWTFSASRKSALGFLTIGQAIGQIIVPFITTALAGAYGWNGTFLILSAIMSFQGIATGLLLHMSTAFFTKPYPKETHTCEIVSIYKDGLFIFYLTGHVAFFALSNLEQWFSVDLAIMKGFSDDAGAALLSINGVCGLIGRVTGSSILNKFVGVAPDWIVAFSILFWGFSHVLMINAIVYRFLVFGMVIRGFSAGHFWSCLPALQIELRGIEEYPRTSAICCFVAGASQIFGGFLGGYTADVTGKYDTIFYIGTATSVYASLCLLIVLFVRERRRRDKNNVFEISAIR